METMKVYRRKPQYVNVVQYKGVVKDLPETFRKKIHGTEDLRFGSCWLWAHPGLTRVEIDDYLVMQCDGMVIWIAKDVFEATHDFVRE